MTRNRIQDNKRNRKTYHTLIQLLKTRTQGVGNQVLPHPSELQALEVFSKLVQAGWIVKKPEFLQILTFCGLDFHNSAIEKEVGELSWIGLKEFFKRFAREVGCTEREIETELGIK